MRIHHLKAVVLVGVLASGAALSYCYIDSIRAYIWGGSTARIPDLECPEIVDIGPVEYGTVVEARFMVKNRGSGQLVLSEFRASCACQSVEVKRENGFVRAAEVRLGPDQTAEMRLVLSVNDRAQESLRTPIYFRTNLPAQPERVVIVAIPRILAGLVAFPSSLSLGEIPVGSSARYRVELFDARQKPRKIIRVRSRDSAHITAKLIPDFGLSQSPDGANRGHLVGTIEIEINTAVAGSIDNDVFAEIDDGSTAPDAIRVTGRIVAPIEISPSVLFLPRSTSVGQVYSGTCLCRSTSGQDFELTVAQFPKGMSVTIEAAVPESPGMRTVKFELRREFLDANVGDGSVTVRMLATLSGRQHELIVPVRFRNPAAGGPP